MLPVVADSCDLVYARRLRTVALGSAPKFLARTSMDELEDCMDQVYRMALAAMQSHTFWLYTRPDDSPYEAQLKRFGHFFYATHEAHLTMMFISLDCLYDDNPKRLNFARLLELIAPKVPAADLAPLKERFEKLAKEAEGVGIIRNNSFAHVAEWQTRIKMGEKYGLSQGGYLSLCYNTFDFATQLAQLLGRDVPDAQAFSAEDVDQIQAIFGELDPGA